MKFRSWSHLEQEVQDCRACDIAMDQKVFGDGDPEAEIVLVGEGPGYHEARLGVPFIGRSGGLLDQAIEEAGLFRPSLFITNVLRCQAWKVADGRRKDRNPNREEIDNCSPFLYATLDRIKPSVIVALGVPAMKVLIRKVLSPSGKEMPDISDETRRVKTADLNKLVKKGYTLWYNESRVLHTVHPAYVLRQRSTTKYDQIVKILKQAREITA